MLLLRCGAGRIGVSSPGSTGGSGLPQALLHPGLRLLFSSGLALGESLHGNCWGLGQRFSLKRLKGSKAVCERNRFPYFWEVEVESLAELLCSPHTVTPAAAGAWECSQADLIPCSRPTLAWFTWVTWVCKWKR